MRYEFGGLIFGGAYTWRGLFSEFYGITKSFSSLFSTRKVNTVPLKPSPDRKMLSPPCNIRHFRNEM